jgi:hypothetical protein
LVLSGFLAKESSLEIYPNDNYFNEETEEAFF